MANETKRPVELLANDVMICAFEHNPHDKRAVRVQSLRHIHHSQMTCVPCCMLGKMFVAKETPV